MPKARARLTMSVNKPKPRDCGPWAGVTETTQGTDIVLTAVALDSPLQLFNPDPNDVRVHPNALFFYPDEPEHPLFFVVAMGHLLNLTPNGPVAFENGSHVRTMPFHVDTARFDKPPQMLAPENLAAIRSAYKLPLSTPLTLHICEKVEFRLEEHFGHDLPLYAQTYQEQRESEIIDSFGRAATLADSLTMPRPRQVPLMFGIDILPAATESPLYDSLYKDQPADVKAYVTVWNLLRRPEYLKALQDLVNATAPLPPRLTVHFQPKQDGSWCLGLERREPLALFGAIPEIAHFHRVVSNPDEAVKLGMLLAAELQRQFELSYVPEVFLDRERVRE